MTNTHATPTRQSVEAAIERLAVLNASPNQDLRDHALRVIDDVAGYLSAKHHEIPEVCFQHLENAVRAVSEGHFPRVIHETHNALDASDRPGQARLSSTKPKPMQPHTDKLLAKLKRLKASTS